MDEVMEIKDLKNKCHKIFDSYWKSRTKCNFKNHIRKVRRKAYLRLAEKLHTDCYKCHFHNMNDIDSLNKAYQIIIMW